MSLRVYYEVLNQKGTPALYTDTFANRPAFGFQGRLFVSTDTGQIFEDTGSAWTLVADAGVGGGTLSSVTANGNTTAFGIVVTAGGLSTNALTTDIATINQLKAVGSGGLSFNSNNGTQILSMGGGGGTGVTFNGTTIFSSSIYSPELILNSSGTASQTFVKNISSASVVTSGSNQIGFNSNDSLYFSSDAKGCTIFEFNNPGDTRTYTLPGTTGTLALTSDLGSYLPLAGGTLTGALSGTSATFSGAVNSDGRFGATTSTTSPSDGSAYFYKSSSGAVISGFQFIAETGGAGSRATRLTIDSTGNAVFSGSAIFGSDVTTTGSGFQGRYARIYEASAQRGGMYPYNIISGAGTDYSIGLFSESSMWFAANGGVTKNVSLTTGGNLLIGTTTDNGNKLQVNGVIYNFSNGGATFRNQYSKVIPVNGTVTYTFTNTGGIIGFNIILGAYVSAGSGWCGGTITGGGYIGANSTIYNIVNNVNQSGSISVSITKFSTYFEVTLTNSSLSYNGISYITIDTTGDILTIS